MLVVLGAGITFAAIGLAARADEPLFGYVNTTDLLPHDKLQLEQWVTQRSGAAVGRYRRIESRTEVDYGLNDNLQLSAYLNGSHVTAHPQVGPGLDSGQLDGVTAEAIWRLASPYLNPLGVAVLVDATTAHGEHWAGLKAIAQKNFRDDTLILAANLRVDVGQRMTTSTDPLRPRHRAAVTPVELDLGASYRFRPNWSLAAELRARSRFAGGLFSGASGQSSAVYLGPTLHYGGQRWFLTASALRRIHGDHPALPATDRLADAAERTAWDGLRLRIGRTF